MSENGPTMQPLIFTNRVEKILMSFYKSFYSQEKIFATISNEFLYKDNVAKNSLIINMSEDLDIENADALPALVLTEGGAAERIFATNNMNYYNLESSIHHISWIESQYSVTAITAHKGTCKILAGSAFLALIVFRRALAELGLERIGELSMSPPQKISSPTGDKRYAMSFSFSVSHLFAWKEMQMGALEEQIEIKIKSFDPNDPDQEELLREVIVDQ